jgi:hypothetical protein
MGLGKEASKESNWDISADFIFGQDDTYDDLDHENEQDLEKLDKFVVEDMPLLSKKSALRIKDIYYKLRSKL